MGLRESRNLSIRRMARVIAAANPPRGISGTLIAGGGTRTLSAAFIRPTLPSLDQVEEQQPAIAIPLGDETGYSLL